jgi:small subunit ribosomal protein S20
MANHPSAAKRHRQSLKRAARNTTVRSTARTAVKKVRVAVEENRLDDAAAALRLAQKTLDQAASKGVLHRNNASRRASRLAKQIARASAGAAS